MIEIRLHNNHIEKIRINATLCPSEGFFVSPISRKHETSVGVL